MDKRAIFLLAFVAIVLALALAFPAQSPERLYSDAVKDASKDNSGRIAHNLVPLTDQSLVRDSKGRVLLVTWTSWNGYSSAVSKDLNLSAEVWASVGREAQEFCKSLPRQGWALRTEQKLGLPPGNNKTTFVELFVDPLDVFRPCADSETTDTECGLGFPANASAEHRAWFDSLRSKSYGEKGYPWTRLGYTYDWGSSNHFGLSEYAIRPGAAVRVAGAYPSAEYCGKAG